MNPLAFADQFKPAPLLVRAAQQSREPNERNRELPSIDQMNDELIIRDKYFARQRLRCLSWGCAHTRPSKTPAASQPRSARAHEARELRTLSTSPTTPRRARTLPSFARAGHGCEAAHRVRCCRRKIDTAPSEQRPARTASIPEFDAKPARHQTLKMLAKSYRGRMLAALKDPFVNDEQVAVVVGILHEQMERVEKQCGRSYLFYLAAAVFSLLVENVVQTVSVSGLMLSPHGATSLLIPVLAAYFAYRSLAAAVYAQVLHQANGAYWNTKLAPFARNNITELFEYPTPYTTEAILANLAGGTLKRFAVMWLFAITFLLCLGPICWFAWASLGIWHWPTT